MHMRLQTNAPAHDAGAIDSPRLSLATKLSLLSGGVIALSLIVALGMAYAVLTRSAIASMRTRLATSTGHLAGIAQAGLRQNGTRYATVAHSPVLRQALTEGAGTGRDDSTLATTRRLLASLVLPTDSTPRIELRNATGERVIAVVSSSTERATRGTPSALREAMVTARTKDAVQLSRLYVVDGRVYFWLVQPVIERDSTLGYIAQQRRLDTNSQTDRGMRALAGEGVSSYYANSDGSVWTTLGGRPAGARSLSRQSGDAHAKMLMASAPIAGTPLSIVMESDLDWVLAPSRSTLVTLSSICLTVIAIGMGAALLIGRRMVGPIVAIADAAESMARGHYEVRVSAARETELARLADSFNHMANEIAAAEETRREVAHMGRVAAVAELASSITHELRQPLTAILANAESGLLLLGKRTPDVDHVQECVRSIVADCERAASVISHIRVLLRKGEQKTTVVDVNQICRDAVYLLRQDAARRRTNVELSLVPEPLNVIGDPVQLQQVVINLTLNALDAASAAGHRRRVTVSTASIRGSAEIAVRDSGAGLPNELERRLFEPFFTTKAHGLGMGLVIVRSIVERHQGKVRAENAGGDGAVFRVTLPSAMQQMAGSGTHVAPEPV